MSRKKRTEVVVVGAGPVGLLTALKLSRLGMEVRILDQAHRTGTHSYALALHKATRDLLDQEGLLAPIENDACRIEQVALYKGAERQEPLSLTGEDGRPLHALVAPQSRLEQVLEDALSSAGIDVEWNHRVESLDPAAGTVRVARLEPVASGYPVARTEWVTTAREEITTGLIIGADGTRSTVRKALGIELRHLAPTQSFSVFEFESTAGADSEAHLVLDENGISVLWPLPGGRRRWTFEIGEPARHQSSAEGLQRLLSERAPWFQEAPGPIRWSSPVTFARCLADSFGRNGAWLAGDAAHLAGPVGAQSLNAGLGEALRLAEAAAGKSNGRDRTLAAYAQDGLGRWRRLLEGAGALDVSAARDPWIAAEAGRLLGCLPATGADLASLMGGLGVRFDPGP